MTTAAEAFYERFIPALELAPTERHRQLAGLHTETLRAYRAALARLTAAEASQPIPGSPDTRSRAEVVGHLAAWDFFAIQAAGDVLAGITHPRMTTDLDCYRAPDGTSPAYATIDDYNAGEGGRFATRPWPELRAVADDLATTLHTLFTQPGLLTAERLERTKPMRRRLHNGAVIENLTMGWSLWVTMIEHVAFEHADLLEL